MRHNIVITEKDNKYYFQLWYCGKQEMGTSKEYDSYIQCKEGLDNFKKFISLNDIQDECKFLELRKVTNRHYIYQFFDENQNILYTSRGIESKQSCKKSMLSTCKNIISAKIKE